MIQSFRTDSVKPDQTATALIKVHCLPFGPGRAKMCLMPYANNKGADQPAHLRSLISAFVVRSLDSIISLVFRSEISRFHLISVAEQAGLNVTWSQTPEDTLSLDRAHSICIFWTHYTNGKTRLFEF